jgi:hypothetical protein
LVDHNSRTAETLVGLPRSFPVALVAILALPCAVIAAPAADLVVVWAPGGDIGPIEKAAKVHGAAVIDRSPEPPAPVETARLLQQGIDAYENLKFDEAQAALDQARDIADRTGGAGLSNTQLSDLFLYRGLVKTQLTDASAAWDELTTSIVVAPDRHLDPARFPPKVAEALQRANQDVLQKRASAPLAVNAPPSCTTTVDGIAQTGEVKHITGPHWVRALCPDYAPWGVRMDLTSLGARVEATLISYAPPREEDLLVQARVASARSLVVVEVHGQVATARLIAIDGRELDRTSVTVHDSLAPVGAAVDQLLTPKTKGHWYQKRWAWAAGAAILAGVILVPITAAVAADNTPGSWGLKPQFPGGVPPL